jgi:GNAT superfamily N-acetyltransferase
LDIEQIMCAYNEFERKSIGSLDGKVIATPELVKFVSDDDYGSYISYFELTKETAPAAISREKAYFLEKGVSVEWKTYSTDSPSNIGQLLTDQGFVAQEPESFMVLLLSEERAQVANKELKNSLQSQEDVQLVEVFDAQGIKDAIAVQQQVWSEDLSGQYRHLLSLKTQCPNDIAIYVIYHNGQPVTSAWVIFNASSPFAGIWGGSTLEAYRGKGFYSLLLNKRIAQAYSKDKKYLIIDASPMSRPIVEKHGFQYVATTTPYVLQASQ